MSQADDTDTTSPAGSIAGSAASTKPPKFVTRRSVTTGLAAAVTAIPAVGFSVSLTMAKGEPGALAALVRRYFAEVDVFNATGHPTDEESDSHAAATYEATLQQIIGIQASNAEDALAAIDWLVKEGVDFGSELGRDGPYYRVVTSLVEAIRSYIKANSALHGEGSVLPPINVLPGTH